GGGFPDQILADVVEQAHSGVAGTQVTADLVLELVPGLWRVPAWRPGERNLLTILFAAGIAFHGVSERRVLVLRLTRFMHADVGAHGGTAAVAQRLARHLQALDTERGEWRGSQNARKLWVGRGAIGGGLIQVGPVNGLALQRALQRVHPAPAFSHQDLTVVIAGLEDLEEALRAAFLADQGAI